MESIQVLEETLHTNCKILSIYLEMDEFQVCEMIVNSVNNPVLKDFLVESINKSIKLINFHV